MEATRHTSRNSKIDPDDGDFEMSLTTTLLIASLAVQAEQAPNLGSFLRDQMHLQRSDFLALERGDPVVRQLVTGDSAEIAFLGVVRVRASERAFRQSLQRIEPLLRFKGVQAMGRLSDPPSMGDLNGLRLTEEDLRALSRCRPGSCDVKLPDETIRALDSLDATAPDFGRRALGIFRRSLLHHVRRYMAEGDLALAPYHDKPVPFSEAAGFRFLLRETPQMFSFVPGLRTDLATPPDSSRAQSSFFWAVEESASKPVTTLNQLVVLARPPGSKPGTLALVRQLYASHYFDASLQAMGWFDADGNDPGPGNWLVYLHRALFDRELGSVKRGILRRRVAGLMRVRLRWLKSNLES